MIDISESSVIWYAVRCCCTPRKLFGFIRTVNKPLALRINVIDLDGVRQILEVRWVCNFADGTMLMEPAISSDDRPIEFWRNIQGFVEAVP